MPGNINTIGSCIARRMSCRLNYMRQKSGGSGFTVCTRDRENGYTYFGSRRVQHIYHCLRNITWLNNGGLQVHTEARRSIYFNYSENGRASCREEMVH